MDFTWAGTGPMTIRHLSDWGATVVRIESETHPCFIRTTPPYKDGKPGLDRAAYFALFSANKYSMCVDLSHPRGKEVIKRLVSWADIVADNFAAGMMEKWELGYEDLKKIKPDIIMFRTNGQGQTGPYSQLRGVGVNFATLAGFAYLCGWPDRTPINPYGAYTDVIGPRFGAAMLIAALDYRRRTGKGQLLDMSQFEASVHFLTPLVLDYIVNHHVANRMGNYCPYAAPHAVYRCRGEDRWCAIAVFSDEEWQSFCRVIGSPSWTKEPGFSTLLGRKEHEAELDQLVEEWTINHTAEEVMTLMQREGVAAGVVKTTQEMYEDPQLKHRDHFWKLNHEGIGPLSHLRQATSYLSKTPAEARMPSPLIGQHTEYVCKELLGMPEEEYVSLLLDGVFS